MSSLNDKDICECSNEEIVNELVEPYHAEKKEERALTPENEKSLQMIAEQIQAIEPEEALIYARRAVEFARVHNRKPNIDSSDPWEVQLAKGVIAFIEYKNKGVYDANRSEKN